VHPTADFSFLRIKSGPDFYTLIYAICSTVITLAAVGLAMHSLLILVVHLHLYLAGDHWCLNQS
jgi:hypothetical protein